MRRSILPYFLLAVAVFFIHWNHSRADVLSTISGTTKNQNKVDTSGKELARMLAKELESIGIPMDPKRLDSLTQAITKGGKPAMSLAMILITSISELQPERNVGGKPPAGNPRKSLQPNQVNVLLDSLNKGNRANLELSRYLKPRLTQLKVKN